MAPGPLELKTRTFPLPVTVTICRPSTITFTVPSARMYVFAYSLSKLTTATAGTPLQVTFAGGPAGNGTLPELPPARTPVAVNQRAIAGRTTTSKARLNPSMYRPSSGRPGLRSPQAAYTPSGSKIKFGRRGSGTIDSAWETYAFLFQPPP